MIDIAKTILAINPNAEFKIIDENFNTIEWLNGTTSISKSDIEAKQAELQTAYDAKEYQRDRSVAYAEIKEQLDLLYHDMAADKGDKTGKWFKAIKAVKDANPKG
tara:strand:- start:65 stop:379 length:315 start_codon:yes stop_codon:yes gene_type:complete